MEEVGVGRERALAALVGRHLDLMRFGPLDQRAAAGQLPLAPRGDDADVGVERIGAELEADLVVALAGGPMRDGIGAGLARDLDQAFGDERPGNAGAEQVVAFVARVHPHHREHEVAHELFAQILDEDVFLGDAHCPRLVARRAELLALAQIGGEGHHLAAALHAQPFGDHRSVQPAGIGEHDALDRGGLALGHRGLSLVEDGGRARLSGWTDTSNRLVAA